LKERLRSLEQDLFKQKETQQKQQIQLEIDMEEFKVRERQRILEEKEELRFLGRMEQDKELRLFKERVS